MTIELALATRRIAQLYAQGYTHRLGLIGRAQAFLISQGFGSEHSQRVAEAAADLVL